VETLNNRFSKQLRFRTGDDFLAVIRSKYRISGGGFIISALKTKQPYPRLGICVSKKILRRAVERNRVKRIVRESFRLQATKMLAGLDIVVRLSSRPEACANLTVLWSKLERICNDS